MQTHVK
ncbi:hypothetical protein YPPY04_4349, partial [Yersinia pestis PY-04]